MEDKIIKISATGLGAIVTYMKGNITPMIFVLILFEAMDYISGVSCAVKNGGLSSSEAIWGFAKKLFYFFVIAVAFSFDYVVFEVGSSLGLGIEWPTVFGVLSVCYLISAEAISILENLSEMGINIRFLTGALKLFQTKIEERGAKND